jgi:hypothetical protein
MTTMDTTMPTLADLRRADQTRRAIEGGGRPSLDDLRHLNRIKGGAAQTAPAPAPNIAAQFAQPREGVFPYPGGATPPDLAASRAALAERAAAPSMASDAFTPAVTDPWANPSPQLAADIRAAAPAVPAPPPGWNPGTEPLSFYDVPVVGPVARAMQTGTETENERLARQYATPQLHGPAAFGTQVARFAGGVLDPGGQVANSAAATFERGGSGIEAAASGGISAALNVARIPFLDPIERAGTNLVMRSAPDVVRQGAGLAARGAAAGVGLGEAQALAEGVAGVPRAVGEQAAAGSEHPIAAAITEEIRRFVEAQPEILTSGALGGVVGEAVMKGLGRAAGTRPQETPGLRPGGAAEVAGGNLRPGDAIAPPAPTPDQAQARAAEAAPVPNPEESAPFPPAQQTFRSGTTGVPVEKTSSQTEIPRNTSPGAAERYSGESIRSGDTLPEGSTVTNRDGAAFTVGRTLDNGKVVLTTPGGQVVRRTAGEMEARGWRRSSSQTPPAEPSSLSPEPSPASRTAPPAGPSDTALESTVSEPSSETGGSLKAASRPEVQAELPRSVGEGLSSPNDTGRVGPPPETVANPSGLPKGEKPPESLPEQVRPAINQDAASGLIDKANPPPEPNQPGFWQSMRDRAQARIDERRAAELAASKGKAGRRGSAGSLDPQTIADRAVILASHIAEAGVKGAKAIKAKARELFGSDDPAVVRAAYQMLREGQGADGNLDPARLELAAHDALTEAQAKARIAPNESADVREMMAKREGDRRAAEAKAEGKQKTKDAREAEQYLRRDAVAAERAKGQIAADAAEATRKEQAARDKTRLNVAVGLEREAGQQSADVREGMAKRAGEIALSKVGQKAREDRQAMREAFALKADDQKSTRQALANLAEEQLEPADRAKVLRTIASASSDADARRAVERILNVEKVADLRDARKALKDTTGKKAPEPKIQQPSLASQINQAQGVKAPPKTFRAGRIGPREVAKLRTNYRDALAPVVEAVRNDHTTGVGKLADFIQGETDAGRSNAFDDAALNVLRAAEGKLLSELDAQQLRAVNDAVEHVAFLSDNANKAQVLGEKRDLDALRTDAVHDVRERWGTKEAKNPGRTMGKLAQTVKDFVVTDQDTLSTMVATVAGKDTTAHQVLYENVAKGESAQRLALRRAMDASGLKDWSAKDMAAVNKDREIKYSGGKVKLKGWEMMEILAAWGDPSTRAELEDAGFVKQEDRGRADRKLFFTDRDITAIEAAMTPKERTSIDPLRKALKMAYAEANDAHERMNGFRLPDTENHWSRTRAMEQTEREVGGELTKEAKRHNWFEDAGIFKDRSTTKAPVVIRNPFEWVPDQLHTLTGMAHLAEPIRAARRVMAAPEVKTEFAAKGGDKWVPTMEARLAALAGTPGDNSPLNKLGQAALGVMARSKLAWRLSSVVKQRLGMLQAASSVKDPALSAKLRNALVSVRALLPSTRAALRAEIDPRSGYLADRADPAFSEALATAANPHLVTSSSRLVRWYQAVERAGLSGLQFADGDVVLNTYRVVRDHLAKTKGLTGDALKDAAVWETEKIIRESQNPTSVLDMSGLNLSGRKNAGIGFLTLFTSSANKMRNQMRQASSDFAADPSVANGRQLAKVATLTATNAVAANLIGRVTAGAALAAAIAWMRGDKMDKKREGQNAVGILADLADTAQPGLGEAIRIPSGQSFANGGFLSNLWSTSKKAVEAFGDEDMRGVDKADKVLRSVRALELLPDAPLDYAGQVAKGLSGPEPAGWSIAAALKRNDYKTALQRAQKLAALKLQKTKDGEPVDPADVQQSIEASIRAYLNRGLKKGTDDDAMADNAATARDLASDAMP